ncbi:aminotransferase class I/II-fold pyridoxal phosphate-dependent enzyme [Microbacterium sp. C7(2022)]|uniref:aminotransferase class I/II-fold pyridoxal phosphate-dependent enzyme n=1 Tax=Microbacterium sp. C7(2022) TaxID=2992759 RepID=UPI00237B87BB|nr:aminotransferase class I/II-fold pyridoxal phosphate-dependent enzyme [Microbacterium sp. C7(2022)]MDE0545517.1 aminotransferase class I/II-fold pyridoxal phosphate-dependent enzyme [Microbacterium sp. C7(2022)]
MTGNIRGGTAAEIVESVRELVERGSLAAGQTLPPVRGLAEKLGVNRNTVVSAYRTLAQAGIVVSRGRAGTSVASQHAHAQEGYSQGAVLRDVGTGNPDPALIPGFTAVLRRIAERPVLYGEPVIDPNLEQWAAQWMSDAVPQTARARLTVTGGAVDAVERLLAGALTRDDAVALEDPCFLASIQTVRLGGYRAVPVRVDKQGITVDGLRSAIEAGVRAVVLTPRAQNPTGVSLSAERASELRALLAEHPYLFIIEDDHFSLLSDQTYHSVIPTDHQRWAVVRSVSKFLGPDMCLAVVASDGPTADRLALRLSPGTTWVSHLLQRLAHALLTDADSTATIERARAHYAQRNTEFRSLLATRDLACESRDGMNLWVDVGTSGQAVAEQLMRRGWLARTGDEFVLADESARRHLRLTVHDLGASDAQRLADDVAAARDVAVARGMIEQ